MNPYFIESLQNAGAGLGAGLPNTQSNGYSINPFSVGAGAAGGFATGGPVGMGVGAGTALAGQVSGVRNAIDNTQTQFDGTNYDGYGRPVYNGSAISQGINSINELEQGRKSAMTWIDPSARFVFDRKANQVRQGMRSAQNQYNEADRSYRGQMNVREDYNQRLNSSNRLWNLYKNQI
jgi:hypothetical protein